ncbi:MAG: 2-oxo-tetronate isomerase [Geminicoccaceae bacterium]
MVALAANLSMLWPDRPFLERFAAARKAGFDAIEYLFPYDHPSATIKAQLEQHRLKQVLFNAPPGDWDAGERGFACHPKRQNEFAETIDKALDYAKALECRYLHVMAGIQPDDKSIYALLEVYVTNLKEAAKRCAKAGVTVLIEPINQRSMPGYFLHDFATAERALASADEPNIALQFDIFHAQIIQGDLAHTLARLMPSIRHVQIAGVPDRHEPDSGELNIGYLFAKLDALGYAGHVGCEYVPAGDTDKGLVWRKQFRLG